jgi:hypothetical protein
MLFTCRVVNEVYMNRADQACDFVFGLAGEVDWISLAEYCLAMEGEIAGCSLGARATRLIGSVRILEILADPRE